MSSLEDAYDGGGRGRRAVRATLLLGGSLFAAVGFVAATASLVAGFGLGKAGALEVAVLLGGTLLLVGFVVRSIRASSAGRSRALAGVGSAVGVAGLALFWTALPAGWTGNLAELPPAAVTTYATGLLVAFWAGLGAKSADASTQSSAGSDSEFDSATSDGLGVESFLRADADERQSATGRLDGTPPSSAVGDGGEDEGDLQFFDDDGGT